MKKLSEYKDEEALDLLADLLVPLGSILTDKSMGKLWKENRFEAIAYAIKHHKKQVMEIMARLENVKVKDYHCNMITLPMQILSIFNDNDLMGFFGDTFSQMGS